ncbi:MAG: integrase arm-type DNA-binding domain-containing protein [Micropepsaceae bacterium]
MAEKKLTETRVRSAKPGWHGDGGGLWLRVSPAGNRSWVFVSVRNGRRREMGLGPFQGATKHVSLAAARDKAKAVREILGRGGDPFKELPERIATSAPKTFGVIVEDLLAAKTADFKNEKHKAQWEMTLRVYAKPLHRLPVAEVTADDVLTILKPMWREKPETASRLRGRIEKAIDYATALGLRSGENPARWKGHMDHLLGKREKLTRGHHAAMPYADVPTFVARLRGVEGYGARALELTILCATRTTETLGAQWGEFDLETALWTVPAARMKMAREHVVPLSSQAVTLLKSLKEKALGDWVFPSMKPKRPLSNMAMTAVLRRMSVDDVTVHGFRSSFRDWSGDATNFPRDVAEMALAHRVGDETEIAYRRSSAVEKRRKLMEAWARFCTTLPKTGNVVAISKGAA